MKLYQRKRKVVLSSNTRQPDRSLETLMAAKRHRRRKKLSAGAKLRKTHHGCLESSQPMI